MKKKLLLLKRPNLTKGQKELYSLICLKIQNSDVLSVSEVKNIYVNLVNRWQKNGIPYYYDFWKRNEKGEIVGGLEPMTESQLMIATVTWLTQNIGSLVLKGYLQVIPKLQLNS